MEAKKLVQCSYRFLHWGSGNSELSAWKLKNGSKTDSHNLFSFENPPQTKFQSVRTPHNPQTKKIWIQIQQSESLAHFRDSIFKTQFPKLKTQNVNPPKTNFCQFREGERTATSNTNQPQMRASEKSNGRKEKAPKKAERRDSSLSLSLSLSLSALKCWVENRAHSPNPTKGSTQTNKTAWEDRRERKRKRERERGGWKWANANLASHRERERGGGGDAALHYIFRNSTEQKKKSNYWSLE